MYFLLKAELLLATTISASRLATNKTARVGDPPFRNSSDPFLDSNSTNSIQGTPSAPVWTSTGAGWTSTSAITSSFIVTPTLLAAIHCDHDAPDQDQLIPNETTRFYFSTDGTNGMFDQMINLLMN